MDDKWYKRLFYAYVGDCYRTECLEVTRWRCWRCRTFWILRIAERPFYRDVRRKLGLQEPK